MKTTEIASIVTTTGTPWSYADSPGEHEGPWGTDAAEALATLIRESGAAINRDAQTWDRTDADGVRVLWVHVEDEDEDEDEDEEDEDDGRQAALAQSIIDTADESGTLQASDVLHIAPGADPTLHTTSNMWVLARALGCVAEMRLLAGWDGPLDD